MAKFSDGRFRRIYIDEQHGFMFYSTFGGGKDGKRMDTIIIREPDELEERTIAETMDAIMEADIQEEKERKMRREWEETWRKLTTDLYPRYTNPRKC